MAGIHIGLEQEVMRIGFTCPKPSDPFGGLGIAHLAVVEACSDEHRGIVLSCNLEAPFQVSFDVPSVADAAHNPTPAVTRIASSLGALQAVAHHHRCAPASRVIVPLLQGRFILKYFLVDHPRARAARARAERSSVTGRCSHFHEAEADTGETS